jgi:hypothetical protein
MEMLLVDVEELMADAGAPETQIDRVGEAVGDDDVHLVIWIGGARLWVGSTPGG